jgi:hypothetical protein
MYFIKRLRQAALGLAGLFSVPFGKKVEKSFSNIIDDKATIYDDKIDQFYNETHIGGFTHRHFDGSHSPILMWEKVKEALPDDSNLDEFKNYILSLSKDLQTSMGIPLLNINDKEAFDKFSEYMSLNFSIKKSWLLDIQSVNLAEIFGATLGVVSLFFGWKKNEKEEFANHASSLILAGAISANPILFIVSIVSWAKSYTRNKNKKDFKEGTIKGLLGMGSFILSTSLFASPLLGIIVGLVVLIVVKKNLKKIEVSQIYDWFKNQIKNHGKVLVAMGGGAGIAMMMGAI